MHNLWRWSAVVLLALGTGRAVAQDPESLRHARLVVWIVHPAGANAPASQGYGGAARRPPGYNEQTTGNFGTAASQYGSSASTVGASSDTPLISREAAVARTQQAQQNGATTGAPAAYVEKTPSEMGTAASDYGTNASNHGQTPSTLGQAASTAGTQAANYGQNAGNPINTPAPREAQASLVTLLGTQLRQMYPDARVRFVTMNQNEVAANLRSATASTAPDLLVFESFGATWPGPPDELQKAAGVHLPANPLAGRLGAPPPGPLSSRLCVVLPKTRHRAAAEAFADYLRSQGALKVNQ